MDSEGKVVLSEFDKELAVPQPDIAVRRTSDPGVFEYFIRTAVQDRRIVFCQSKGQLVGI